MTYLVTGATGFVGRHVVARLLERGGTVHVIARNPNAAVQALGDHGDRLRIIPGDLAEERLGLGDAVVDSLRGRVEHFFHVAGLYDLEADPGALEEVNVAGTRRVLALARELEVATLHHVSSIAVAGSHSGTFSEEMLEEGQDLPHAYHRTKYEAERLVRRSPLAWRVYRPAIVVGHSRTGVADKPDGPYQLFKGIQKLRGALPEWFPLLGPELGHTNLVPVDYVADAIDFLAHRPGLDRRAFHLVSPEPQLVGDVLNTFARAAHAPRLALRVDPAIVGDRPLELARRLLSVPPLTRVARLLLERLAVPEAILAHVVLRPRFDVRATTAALEGSGIAVPSLDDYAWRLWDFWERHLDPALDPHARLADRVAGRVVLITGASSGIGRAAALRLAAAGARTVLVARSVDALDAVRDEIVAGGGEAHVEPCDLSDVAAIDALVGRVTGRFGAVDVLVNNAGRSIRRSTALSYERFHDFERTIALNYLGAVKLTMGLLPEMRRRRRGHVINVSSIGVQANPPRFSAYVASKAALDAWTRVVASETAGEDVAFTTIHMPLVRTPMIAPTRIYDAFPIISPDEAAELICDAVRRRPKRIDTRLGSFAELSYAAAPKLVDALLHRAYEVFPDSPAASGDDGAAPVEPSREAMTLAHVMRGVYW